MINNTNGTRPLNYSYNSGARPTIKFDPESVKDQFTPNQPITLNLLNPFQFAGGSKGQIIGMPDPSKYPDYNKDRKDSNLIGSSKSEWSYTPDYEKYPKDKPGICGGWDAPMFHNGKVMSRREYHQREAAGML